jgi:hypothetical protein
MKARWGFGSTWAVSSLAALAAALIAACGGVGTGGTGTFASGPITGFGSVIVNDVTFDDSGAEVLDAEGARRTTSALKLGMTAEVTGEDSSGRLRATQIRYGGSIVGPVERITGAAALVVFGQRVTVDETTIFDAALPQGLASLAAGHLVEVHAAPDGQGEYRATRIEPRAAATSWRLLGVVAAHDAAARTLRVGTAQFTYTPPVGAGVALAVGSLVRLTSGTAADGNGRYPVLAVADAVRGQPDQDAAVIKGFITQFTSAQSFQIDGRSVDASQAQISGGPLALGQRVQAQGALRSGVLQARAVEVRTDAAERERGYTLRGPIESVAADRTSFVLRGVLIGTTSPALRYENGDASGLIAGREVDLQGHPARGRGDGLDARRIRFVN